MTRPSHASSPTDTPPPRRVRGSTAIAAFAYPVCLLVSRQQALPGQLHCRNLTNQTRLHRRGISRTSFPMPSSRSNPRGLVLSADQPVSAGHPDHTEQSTYGSINDDDTGNRTSNLVGANEQSPMRPNDHGSRETSESALVDSRWILGGFMFVAISLVGLGSATGGFSLESFMKLAEWFEGLGPGAIIVYSLLYFLLELLAVPATPLTLGCGYLFGVTTGAVAVSISATCAAATSFLIARYGLRNYITKIAKKYPKFRAIDSAIGREGFKFVFLLRLSPLLPFAISNYLYGLTSVRFRDYVLGSWLGMLPGTIAYVSGGAAVSALTDLNANKGSINPTLVTIGVIATVLALGTIGKLASNAIAETTELEDDAI